MIHDAKDTFLSKNIMLKITVRKCSNIISKKDK